MAPAGRTASLVTPKKPKESAMYSSFARTALVRARQDELLAEAAARGRARQVRHERRVPGRSPKRPTRH
jgi:hypothetical protein